jgi:hypothetical protein
LSRKVQRFVLARSGNIRCGIGIADFLKEANMTIEMLVIIMLLAFIMGLLTGVSIAKPSGYR